MLKKICALFISVILSFYVYSSAAYSANYHPNLSEEEYIEMLNETINHIKNNFVDTDKISLEKIYFGAIEGALKSLDDPYTRFLPPEKYDDLKMKTTSKFGGLGIVISKRDKELTVVSPILGTPAFKLGIKPGDVIIEIENESTENLTLQEAVERMRGEPGTKVTITISRAEFKQPKKFTIIRDIIKIETVQTKMLNEDVGYIRLLEFSEPSHKEIVKALAELKSQGMKKLIFDLRNNPGGLLESAYDISNLFLDRGLVVYTRGRHSHQNKNYYAKPDYYDIKNIPLIVLANGGSASGSEIVVGAIKDNKRGLIVGEKTFGKGLVQSVFPFRNLPNTNSGVAITTAKYYTPSGVCIQDTGIFPDIEIKPKKTTDEEAESLIKFIDKDHALKFVKKYPVYKEEDLLNYIKELKKDGIIVSKEIAESLVKEQYAREEGKHYFADLNTDEVLKRALDLFTTYDIFMKSINNTK
ncbi:S41 family peptidase [Candidatus Dependentiae bacterium]|nr:S41 family peptidase [Candidatus Dependentiae bacterium]